MLDAAVRGIGKSVSVPKAEVVFSNHAARQFKSNAYVELGIGPEKT